MNTDATDDRPRETPLRARSESSDTALPLLQRSLSGFDLRLLEILPQLIWSSDPSGALDYVNGRWVEYTGLDLQQVKGAGWHAVLHPDDRQRAAAAWAQATATGEVYEVTARVRRGSDGTYRWFLARAYSLEDAEGRVLRWFGTCTDIDDQKQYEDSQRLLSEASRVLASSFDLEATLNTVASLVASWFNGYCIIDVLHDGGLQRLAAAHVDPQKQPLIDQLRAYSPGQDPRNPLWRAVVTRLSEVCNEVTEASFLQGAQSAHHEQLRRLMGTTGYVVAPLLASGQAVGTIMLASTSGAPFRAEDVRPVEELAYRIGIAVTNARAFAEAREANRLKDEFLAVVSHELRTPLNAMRGWMSLLRTQKLREEQHAHALEVIDRNITAQTQLVEDLLDISRIVSGRMRLNVELVDLGAVVGSALDATRPAAVAKQITVVPSLGVEDVTLSGDPDRLQQIVWNLLSNAIKFTPRGGRIDVILRTAAANAELTITDSGQGISADFLPYVFDRFRQADSTITRPVGGLGLGLGIVRHLVELHGGTVTAFSEGEGKGASFVVALPMTEA